MEFFALEVKQYRAMAKVGCSESERRFSQGLLFDLIIRFPKMPEACHTDTLADTVCYAELCSDIEKICGSREFHLLEKVGLTVFEGLKTRLTPDSKLWLRVTKEKSPIHNLLGGASFCCGDWNRDQD